MDVRVAQSVSGVPLGREDLSALSDYGDCEISVQIQLVLQGKLLLRRCDLASRCFLDMYPLAAFVVDSLVPRLHGNTPMKLAGNFPGSPSLSEVALRRTGHLRKRCRRGQ